MKDRLNNGGLKHVITIKKYEKRQTNKSNEIELIDRQTDRTNDRQTDKQTDKWTDRHTERMQEAFL